MNYIDLLDNEDGMVRIHIDAEPLSLTPHSCFDYIGQIICQALYEPLFVRNEQTGELELIGATSYDVSENHTKYRFYLDNEKRWSNGEPVLAKDYVSTFQQLVKQNNTLSHYFDFIENAEEIRKGNLSSEMLGVRAVDDFTLQFKLTSGCSFFKELLSSIYTSPSPPYSGLSNGPFVLEKYYPSQKVVVIPNRYYTGNLTKKLNGIEFVISKELEGILEEYRLGKIHITCNTYFPFHRIRDLSFFHDFYQHPSAILFSIHFNYECAPEFQNHKLRKLLSDSIRRNEISRILHDGVIPWFSFIPKGFALHQYTMDIETCKQEVMKKSFNLLFADYYPNNIICSYIRKQWKEVFGIDLILLPYPFKEFIDVLQRKEYDLYLDLSSPLFSNPINSLVHVFGELDEEWQEEAIERLEATFTEFDANKRNDHYEKIDQIFLQQLPFIPVCNGKSIYLKSPYIKGFKIFEDGSVSYRQIDWK